MRYALLALLLPTLAAGQGNEAEKLYRQAEKKVTEAESFRVVFAVGLWEEGAERPLLKGSLLASGNKFRLETTAEEKGKTSPLEYLVSDGNKIKVKLFPAGVKARETPEVPCPRNAGQTLRKLIARAGAGDPEFAFLGHVLKEFDAEKGLQVSELKMGAAEKVRGRMARVVSYKLKAKDYRGEVSPPVKCTIWLDAETLLPLQHLLLADERHGIMTRYTTFDLKAKVDAKSFELPKK
jgi:outer membrane lipoprotein-sorting protein